MAKTLKKKEPLRSRVSIHQPLGEQQASQQCS
jgi:hypothetical protein